MCRLWRSGGPQAPGILWTYLGLYRCNFTLSNSFGMCTKNVYKKVPYKFCILHKGKTAYLSLSTSWRRKGKVGGKLHWFLILAPAGREWSDSWRISITYFSTCGCVRLRVGGWMGWRIGVCACSLYYQACKARAPYCHGWPLWLHHIFRHYLIKGMIFRKRLLK
jgi:hypothetical protein